MLIVFDEGSGWPLHRFPASIGNTTAETPPYLSIGGTIRPLWTSGPGGVSGLCTDIDMSWTVGNDQNWIPTTSCTVAVIRRKTDSTLRVSSLFGCGSDTGANRCGAHCPYSDGTVYWDFGQQSAPNRLSVAGLTFST